MDIKISDIEYENIRAIYQRCCEEWRHYDKQIWEVTNIAIVVNGFLILNSFDKNLDDKVRIIIPLIASLFTFIFLIALTKHRLHQDAKTWNISKLEEILTSDENHRTKYFNYDDEKKRDIELLRGKPFFLVKTFKDFKAFNWLCWMMVITIIIDLIVMTGNFVNWW
jgi:uncharacterized membrane protein YhaH (DUF805 family)